MARYRLVIEYDGTAFHGWQQHEGVRTVEGCLADAARRFTGGDVEIAGASRTDAGVHAYGQSARIVAATEMPPEAFARALAALSPPDVGIVSCRAADDEFHPRHSAIEKRYLYRILHRKRRPVRSRKSLWWLRERLDLDAMQEAAACFVGTHDFQALRNHSKDAPESSVRTIRAATWARAGEQLVFQVIGDGFLYKMVRNIVGTLVEVGRGRLSAARCPEIIASRDRRLAGPTAPAEGLYLVEVAYPDTPLCSLDLPPELA